MRVYYIYFMIVIYNENGCINETEKFIQTHPGIRDIIHHSFVVANDCIDGIIIGFGNRIADHFSYSVQYQNRIFVLLMTWKNIKLTVDIVVMRSECGTKSKWPSTNKLDSSIIFGLWIPANVPYEWFHFIWWRFRFDLDHYSSSLRIENIINSRPVASYEHMDGMLQANFW